MLLLFSLLYLATAANAATLVPTEGVDFGRSLTPPEASSASLIFNWHDDDSGDHNSVATKVYPMTDGGNASFSTPAPASTSTFPLQAVALQFNSSHFAAEPLTDVPWLAIFSCTKTNTSALISNAERLGAVGILAYTSNSATYSWCNLTDASRPGATIPIYATEYWAAGALVFEDELEALFAPSKFPYFPDSAASLTALGKEIAADLAALASSDAGVLIQSSVVLARIPPVSANVSAAQAEASASASATASPPSASATPTGGAVRVGPKLSASVVLFVVVVLLVGLL